jgi:hypothetical protein
MHGEARRSGDDVNRADVEAPQVTLRRRVRQFERRGPSGSLGLAIASVSVAATSGETVYPRGRWINRAGS